MNNKEKLFSIAMASLVLFVILMSTAGAAPFAYITNEALGSDNGTVSVIDTATDNLVATVPVEKGPQGVAVNSDGTKVYVANSNSHTVSVIDTAGNTVINTLLLNGGLQPVGVAISPDGTKVYVTDELSENVSVINTTTNAVISVRVGIFPYGVAVSPDGAKVYVVNQGNWTVDVIDTATNNVTARFRSGGIQPFGVAVSPDGANAYVANSISNATAVIDTVTNNVTPVNVGLSPVGVAVTPDGTKVYVTNNNNATVSVIDTATDTVIATVNVEDSPFGVAVTPDGTKVYVANTGNNSVSVIDTATNNVTTTLKDGFNFDHPVAFGQFIVPPPVVLPVANFSTNVSGGYVPLTVQFTDLSTNATGRNWSFGDGNFSTLENPVHEYTIPGDYRVNLTTTNAFGNASTSTTINVNSVQTLPVANFSSNVTSGYIPLSVKFTDLSTNATSWNWDFGDGNTSTDQNPVNIYSAEGNYTVTLIANNSAGSNTVTKNNYIIATKPEDTIIGGYAPLTVKFIDLSENATSWNWNFGDGNTSTVQNPTYTYSKAGQYTVTLIVRNAAGSNTAVKYSYINVENSLEVPIAAFSASTTLGKSPLNVSFTDNSTGLPNSWKWNFGDGNTSTIKNATHTYSKVGQYDVTLTVSNEAGSNTLIKYKYVSVANSLKSPIDAFSASVLTSKY